MWLGSDMSVAAVSVSTSLVCPQNIPFCCFTVALISDSIVTGEGYCKVTKTSVLRANMASGKSNKVTNRKDI